MRAVVTYKREGNVNVPLARVPAEVRQLFEAEDGDALVFEEGSAFVAEKASVPGPYVVVTLKRAARIAPEAQQPEAEAAAAPIEAPRIESLEEAVRRKLNGEDR